MTFLNGPLPLKGHKSRDLTTKSHVIAIDEEGFGDKFRQVPATRFFLLYLRKLLPSQPGSYIYKSTKVLISKIVFIGALNNAEGY